MDVSVVVCTRNRAKFLELALENWSRETSRAEWELIIVDNGSTDDTARMLEQFRSRFTRPLKILHEATPGTGRAKNVGCSAALAELIAFTDDDCYLAPDFIDRVVECFRAAPIAFLGGRVLLFDTNDLRLTIQELETRIDFGPRQFIPAGLIHGANMSVSKRALDAVGGFDERFGAGTPFACEDVDVLGRLSARGQRGAYDPRPIVYHHHRRQSWANEGRRLMDVYDAGRGAYYAKMMMEPAMFTTYALRCLRLAARQTPGRTLRELRGGVRFLATELHINGHARGVK